MASWRISPAVVRAADSRCWTAASGTGVDLIGRGAGPVLDQQHAGDAAGGALARRQPGVVVGSLRHSLDPAGGVAFRHHLKPTP